jgi:hypothetical protein
MAQLTIVVSYAKQPRFWGGKYAKHGLPRRLTFLRVSQTRRIGSPKLLISKNQRA